MFEIEEEVILKSNGKRGVIVSNMNMYWYIVATREGSYLVTDNDLEKILDKHIKTNILNYNSGQAIISWKFANNNNLNVKIHNGRLNVVTLLKILISEIDDLKEFNYKRVSPYKLVWERPMHREDKNHVYKMVFINVKDNNKVQESEIIKLNSSMSLEEGEYNFFIPDLLELARLKGLVKLEENVYKYVKDKFVNKLDIKYIDDSMSKEKLEENGWIVPSAYVEPK